MYWKARRECALLVSKTGIERPQESDLPDYNVISQFKQKIFDGIYFFCIICNCCIKDQFCYLKTVNTVFHDRYYWVKRDTKMYFRKTCNLKLKMENTPDRAVLYKLCVTDLIKEFLDIQRLEQALTSTVLLFKKVTIILNGQPPKHKWTLCNIPV